MEYKKSPRVTINIIPKKDNLGIITNQMMIVVLDKNMDKNRVAEFATFLNDINYLFHSTYVQTHRVSQELYDRFIKFKNTECLNLFDAYIDNNEELYFSTLQERAKSVMRYFIQDIFFKNYNVSDIDIAAEKLHAKYPLVTKGNLERTKNKTFFNTCVQGLINELDTELPDTCVEVLQHVQELNPHITIHQAMLYTVIDTMLVAACNQEFLTAKFAEQRREKVHALCKDITDRKTRDAKKIQTTPQHNSKPKSIGHTVNEPKNIITESQKRLIDAISKRMTQKVKIDTNYLTRMIKKGGPIYLESVVQDLENMTQEYRKVLLNEFATILSESKIPIYTKVDRDITEALDKKNSVDNSSFQTDGNSEDTFSTDGNSEDGTPTGGKSGDKVTIHSKSPTLDTLQNNPDTLTSQDIVKILEEFGYTIANPKKFSKQLDTLVTNNGILFDGRKKKLLEYLSRDEDVVCKTELVRYTIGQYRILKFLDRNNPPRIIRKGDTILACVDHDTYDRLLIMMKQGTVIDDYL